ncbi:MAG: hypothetical protein ACI4TK_08555 [Agathobacter sp.]
MKQFFLRQNQILIAAVVCVVCFLAFLCMQIKNPAENNYDYSEYKTEYQSYRDLVDRQDVDFLNISIFGQENAYAVKNLEKTYNDYQDTEDVVIQPLTGAQNAVFAVVNTRFIMPVCCMFFIVYYITMYQRREECNRRLEFSLPKGRCSLALYRVLTGYAVTWMFSLLLYIEIFITAFCYYGGWKDLKVPVQSVGLFLQVHHKMVLGEYLLWYCACKAFCIAAFGLLFLAILHILNHKIIAVFFLVLLSLGEILLENIIPIQGRWILLKILNVYSFVFPDNALLKYRNLQTIFGLISTEDLLIIFIVITTLAAGTVIIILSTRYALSSYPSIVLFFVRILEWIKDFQMKFEMHLSWFLMEIYIFLMHRKGWVICLAVLVITLFQYQKDDIIYSAENRYLENFYQEWEGPVSDELLKYLEDWKQELEDVELEWAEKQEAFRAGEITFSEYDDAKYGYQAYEVDRKCYDIIANKVTYIQDYKEMYKKELWVVNDIGYHHLLGNKGYKDIYFTNILLLIFSVLICFSFVKRNNGAESFLQNSCLYGRNKRFTMQLKAAIAIVVVFSLLCFAAHFWYIQGSYGVSAWKAPLQSISGYGESAFPGSIALFYIMQLLRKTGMNVLVVFIIMISSSKIRSMNREAGIAISK